MNSTTAPLGDWGILIKYIYVTFFTFEDPMNSTTAPLGDWGILIKYI